MGDHMFIHLQFNYDNLEEAELAKKELKAIVDEKFSHLYPRLYRKKGSVRFGIPYNGFLKLVKTYMENPDDKEIKDPSIIIEEFIDNFGENLMDCDDIEVSFYWHVNFEPDEWDS